MSEIPEDVKRQAMQTFADADLVETVREAVEIIARAIMAERARCAGVAHALEKGILKFAKDDADPERIVMHKIGADTARHIAVAIERGN